MNLLKAIGIYLLISLSAVLFILTVTAAVNYIDDLEKYFFGVVLFVALFIAPVWAIKNWLDEK